jgi:hypothetical protein
VKKDLFFANDELRNWWIEERDRKLEITAEARLGSRKDTRWQKTRRESYSRRCDSSLLGRIYYPILAFKGWAL